MYGETMGLSQQQRGMSKRISEYTEEEKEKEALKEAKEGNKPLNCRALGAFRLIGKAAGRGDQDKRVKTLPAPSDTHAGHWRALWRTFSSRRPWSYPGMSDVHRRGKRGEKKRETDMKNALNTSTRLRLECPRRQEVE